MAALPANFGTYFLSCYWEPTLYYFSVLGCLFIFCGHLRLRILWIHQLTSLLSVDSMWVVSWSFKLTIQLVWTNFEVFAHQGLQLFLEIYICVILDDCYQVKVLIGDCSKSFVTKLSLFCQNLNRNSVKTNGKNKNLFLVVSICFQSLLACHSLFAGLLMLLNAQ